MRKISLASGEEALVDDEDYERLVVHKWQIRRKGTCYARRTINSNGRRKTLYLHHAVLQVSSSTWVDHENGDGLDNRKTNLRFATRQQNSSNAALSKRNTSGYKGVSWNKECRKWEAHIRYERRKIRLGMFLSLAEAAEAYDRAALIFFGCFARPNIIKDVRYYLAAMGED